MKITKTTYETITLSFEETGKLLKEALKLDKGYKLSARHSGDILWDSKMEFQLTKETEN